MSQENESLVSTPCRICGWKMSTVDGLCLECIEVRQWSRVNRSFCAFIHKKVYPDIISYQD